MELEIEVDNYAVAVIKNSVVVGHLARRKPVVFSKSIPFSLRANNENSCKVEVIGKRLSLGDEHGLITLFNLHFTGHVKFINRLKEILPPLMR